LLTCNNGNGMDYRTYYVIINNLKKKNSINCVTVTWTLYVVMINTIDSIYVYITHSDA